MSLIGIRLFLRLKVAIPVCVPESSISPRHFSGELPFSFNQLSMLLRNLELCWDKLSAEMLGYTNNLCFECHSMSSNLFVQTMIFLFLSFIFRSAWASETLIWADLITWLPLISYVKFGALVLWEINPLSSKSNCPSTPLLSEDTGGVNSFLGSLLSWWASACFFSLNCLILVLDVNLSGVLLFWWGNSVSKYLFWLLSNFCSARKISAFYLLYTYFIPHYTWLLAAWDRIGFLRIFMVFLFILTIEPPFSYLLGLA